MRILYCFLLTLLPVCLQAQSRNLEYYLGQGYSTNPQLQDLSNQLSSASLDSLRVRAGQKPQLTANAGAQYAPSFGSIGYDQAVTNGGNYSATVNASQVIFNRFSLNARLQTIKVHQDSIHNSTSLIRIDLKKAITAQYITAYADLRQLGFQQDLFRLLENQEKYLIKMVQAGIFKQSDYLTFLVSRQAQEVAISQFQNTYHTDLSALNLLAGIVDSNTVNLEEPHIAASGLLPLIDLPGYRKFRIDSLQLTNQRSLLAASYKPKLNWFADAGNQTSRPASLFRSFGTSFGLNFSIPIYDGHLRRIASKQIDLQERSRKVYQNYFTSQYQQQILAVQKQIRDIEQLLGKITNQLKYSKMLIDIDQKLLNTGDLKVNDFLIAINNYRAIQFTQTQQQINRLLLLNQLNYWGVN